MDGAPDDRKVIGQRIYLLRVALGYEGRTGQGEFAKLCGISAPALANYEAGDRRPSMEQLGKFRARIGVTHEFILYGDTSGLTVALAARISAAIEKLEKAETPQSPPTNRGRKGRTSAS